ncbi:hypothetical protein Plhal304r1_c018g0064451 [Plasmopara halstedii]
MSLTSCVRQQTQMCIRVLYSPNLTKVIRERQDLLFRKSANQIIITQPLTKWCQGATAVDCCANRTTEAMI